MLYQEAMVSQFNLSENLGKIALLVYALEPELILTTYKTTYTGNL